MLGDLRYAFRLMARNPGFTTLAILVLALGIGANTAIFSVVDAALFKPLSYRDPEKLVDILRVARPGTAEQVNYMGMIRDDLADWRAQKQIFEGIESYRWERLAVLTAPDRTESMRVCRISPGLVDFLGFKPKLGRGFTSEDAIIGNDHVILLGEGLWRPFK